MKEKSKNPWQTKSRRKVYDNPWIRVEEHQVINPAGGNGIYGKVHYKNRAIGVIPLNALGDTWLVGQYRYTLDDYSWEIPEGGGPMEEAPEAAAHRELREETGLKAGRLSEIMRMHLSNSVSDEEAIIYVAEELSECEADPEDTEELVVRQLPFATALQMVIAGEISDAMSVAGILKAAHLGYGRAVEILYRDQYCVAVRKPAGLLVHRTGKAPDTDSLLQRVRDLVGCRVFPVHRLDRATSGIVLFALSNEYAGAFFELFRERAVRKRYLAVVRGWPEDEGNLDYPLKPPGARDAKPAVTKWRVMARSELPVAIGPYQTSRYSLVEFNPETGRMHQLRRHAKHLRHPIVGDSQYGDGAHNRELRERLGCRRLMLHAAELQFVHPFSNEKVSIECPADANFAEITSRMNLK